MAMFSGSVKATAQVGTGLGLGIMIIGAIALLAPFFTGIATTAMFAVLLLAAGITTLAYLFSAKSAGTGVFQFIVGSIMTYVGGYMLINPTQGLEALTSIVIAYFIVDGIFTLIAGVKLKGIKGWGWIVFSGLSSFILGALLWSQWPVSGMYAIGMLIGIRLMFTGWTYVMVGAEVSQVADDINKETGL